MKKLLIILALIVGSFTVTSAQYISDPFQNQQLNITGGVTTNGWGVIGTACAGCPSYFFKITRSQIQIQAEDGVFYYYYYFWFFSNSYYSNGQQASTYLTNVKAYMNGQYVTGSSYALATRQEKYFVWIRSTNGNSSVTFNVDKMSVY